MSILHRIHKLIPQQKMLKLCMAFILSHFEYAALLFLGLNKGPSEKLESTNAFALRTLRLPTCKTTSYHKLLKFANLKKLEHRRIEQSLVLAHKSIILWQSTKLYKRNVHTKKQRLQPSGTPQAWTSLTKFFGQDTLFLFPGSKAVEKFAS